MPQTMREILLVHISGPDRPGLTAAFTAKLAEYDVHILDMGQAVIHDTLTLGILISIPESSQSAPVVKDLLFLAHDLGITLKCTPVGLDNYRAWVESEGKKRHIVTLLGRTLTARQVAAVSAALADQNLNIDAIHRLSGRVPLNSDDHSRPACVEFSVRGTPRDSTALRKRFLQISAEQVVDIAIQEDTAFRRNRRLVAFDMDSTLIRAEIIDELAKIAGVGDQVSAITEAAMRGELDFKQSLRRRLGLLKGLPVSALESLAAHIPLNDGAEKLITNLKRFGYKTAIISGGFTYFGRKLQEMLGIDYVFANELEIEGGALTGRPVGEIVDAARKAELLTELAARENLSLQQVIAVGDGANDLPMLNLAGLGIAYHAKPVVKEGARQAISTLGLDSILYLVGIRERDMS